MNSLASLAQGEVSRTFTWALVHFLWQGAALALIGALVMRWLPSSAAARYLVGTVTMAAMLVAPVATFLVLAPHDRAVSGTLPLADFAPLPVPSTVAADVAEAPKSAVAPTLGSVLSFLLAMWVGGVVLLSVRLLGGWVVARRLAARALRPVTPDVQRLAREVGDRLRVHRLVRIVESSTVAVPVVIGWLKPVVLLPAAALAGLAPAQLEALLAHELAHVRRHDYLVNLLQSAVETLLFYHPAVWWISGRVRAERENCCDDVAVRVCDRLVYVSALTDLAAMAAPPRLALAATDGSLLRRVRRLLEGQDETRQATGWVAAFAVALLVGGAALSGIAPTPVDEHDTPSNAKATDTGAVQDSMSASTEVDFIVHRPSTQEVGPAQAAPAAGGRVLDVLQEAERLHGIEVEQGASRGDGGQMASRLADLFQRELDRQAAQDETQRARAQGQDQQVDELAVRLRELARRQLEQLRREGGDTTQPTPSDRQTAAGQSREGTVPRDWETLYRRQIEALRQLEQERQRQAPGQLGAGEADAQRALADELEQTAMQLAQRRQATRFSLEQLQRLVAEPYRTQRALEDALRQAEELIRQQREIAAVVPQTSRQTGAARDAQLKQLTSDQDGLRQGVADLEQHLTMLARQAQSSEQREIARRAQELANAVRDEMLKEKIAPDLEALRQRLAAVLETNAADLLEKERDRTREREGVLEVTRRMNALAAEQARIAQVASADRRARLFEQSVVVTDASAIVRLGDVLDIQIQSENDLPRVFEVAGDGKIMLPLLGAVQAAGKTAAEVLADITTLLKERRLGATQQVTVVLRRQTTSATR